MDKHTIDFKRYACGLSENEDGVGVRAEMKAAPKSGEWYRREDVIRLQKRLLKINELIEKDVITMKIALKQFVSNDSEIMLNMSRVGINARTMKDLLRNTEKKIETEEEKESRFKAIRRNQRRESKGMKDA